MAIAKDWYHTEIKNDDMEILHRSPSVEYSFYNAVRSGDMETVTANCKNDSFLQLEGTGVLSRNPLTNIKYHFVVTTAMLTRYCIDGGLEPEQAYRLSDFYILKMDSVKLQTSTILWQKILPEKCFFRKKILFCPNLSLNASTISTVT